MTTENNIAPIELFRSIKRVQADSESYTDFLVSITHYLPMLQIFWSDKHINQVMSAIAKSNS